MPFSTYDFHSKEEFSHIAEKHLTTTAQIELDIKTPTHEKNLLTEVRLH